MKQLSWIVFSILFFASNLHAEDTRPNIVLIVADDLGYGDLGCYGQELIQTPNIDRLAQQGIRFPQAYAGSSVCTASRSVLMTGLHNGHAPARDNVPHYPTYLQDDDLTLAEVLHNAGYRTGGVGKWSLGDAGTVGRATNQGFDSWFGYLNQDHAHYYYTEYLNDNEGRLELTDNSRMRSDYSHDLLTDRALSFLKDAQQTKDPYFLYVAYTLPHFSSKTEDRDGLAVPSTAPYTNFDWDEPSKKYAAMIHLIDRDVGRITQQVDTENRETLIIFTSDNGGHKIVHPRFNTNGILRGYKRDLYEGGIRVPFIARWSSHSHSGSVQDEVIGFQDLLPTFAELANVKAPSKMDGISVAAVLNGHQMTTTRDYLYWDYGHCRKRYDQAVRWNNWKGIRLGQDSEMELYDLENDPQESKNIAQQHPDIVEKINRIMKQAPTPSPRYPIGEIYRGKQIWMPENHGAQK